MSCHKRKKHLPHSMVSPPTLSEFPVCSTTCILFQQYDCYWHQWGGCSLVFAMLRFFLFWVVDYTFISLWDMHFLQQISQSEWTRAAFVSPKCLDLDYQTVSSRILLIKELCFNSMHKEMSVITRLCFLLFFYLCGSILLHHRMKIVMPCSRPAIRAFFSPHNSQNGLFI